MAKEVVATTHDVQRLVVPVVPFLVRLGGPNVLPFAILPAVFESTLVYIPIREPFFALAMLFVFVPLAFLAVS